MNDVCLQVQFALGLVSKCADLEILSADEGRKSHVILAAGQYIVTQCLVSDEIKVRVKKYCHFITFLAVYEE